MNIDELPNGYHVLAYIHPNAAVIPKSVVRFTTTTKDTTFTVTTANMHPLHPETGEPVQWDAIKDRYALDVFMSGEVEIKCELVGGDRAVLLDVRQRSLGNGIGIPGLSRPVPERRSEAVHHGRATTGIERELNLQKKKRQSGAN